MKLYLARRVLHGALVVVSVFFTVFVLAYATRGGEARTALGPHATTQQVEQFDRRDGLTLPFWDQLWRYVDHVAHGNLGYSFQSNQAVSSLIAQRMPRTLVLVGISLFVSIPVAILLALIQVRRRDQPLDHAMTAATFVAYGVPSFAIGTLLIQVFAFGLHWFPAQFSQSESVMDILRNPRGLVLPEITLSTATVAACVRFLRSSLITVTHSDYVRTSEAYGISPRRVLGVHVLRNALIPFVTMLGLAIPALFSGAVVTETVFNYPGMGLLSVNAALDSDVAVLLGVTLLITVGVVVGSLAADIAYVAIDPRIRYDS